LWDGFDKCHLEGNYNANQSAREKCPAKYPKGEAEEYFKSAQKMAADSSAPKEVQELGKVLQRVMLGARNVDLSGLPEEWREVIQRLVLSLPKG
jgi:hypothetical protein